MKSSFTKGLKQFMAIFTVMVVAVVALGILNQSVLKQPTVDKPAQKDDTWWPTQPPGTTKTGTDTPGLKTAGNITLTGWQVGEYAGVLHKKEILFTTTVNGNKYFFVFRKGDKTRKPPSIAMQVGDSISIRATFPYMEGISRLKRSAYDSDKIGKKALYQMASPLVSKSNGKTWLPLNTGGWNGKTVDWTITAQQPTKDFVIASITLICEVASGAGPEGGIEAKYTPKVYVKVSEVKAGKVANNGANSIGGSFQKLGGIDAYIYLPYGQKTADMTVYLAGSGEKGEAVLRDGLPEQVRQFGSSQIVLVPIKKTGGWDTEAVVKTINNALTYLASNGYQVNRLYGDGFSAGGHGIARVAASQKVRIPFTGIKLFGSDTGGVSDQLVWLLDYGPLSSVTFYVGADDKFVGSAKRAFQKLDSAKSSIYVVPKVGHRVNKLYEFARQNTP